MTKSLNHVTFCRLDSAGLIVSFVRSCFFARLFACCWYSSGFIAPLVRAYDIFATSVCAAFSCAHYSISLAIYNCFISCIIVGKYATICFKIMINVPTRFISRFANGANQVASITLFIIGSKGIFLIESSFNIQLKSMAINSLNMNYILRRIESFLISISKRYCSLFVTATN